MSNTPSAQTSQAGQSGRGQRGVGLVVLSFWLLLSLGQLQRITLPGWPAFYFHDLLLAGWVGWLLFQPPWRQWVGQLYRQLPRLCWLAVAWTMAGWLTAISWQQPVSYALLTSARLGLYLVAATGLWWLRHRGVLSQRWLQLCLLAFFATLLYLGLLQYLLIPDTRFLFFLGWDDHYHRLLSTLLDPGFTGLILSFGLLWVLEQTSHRQSFWQRHSLLPGLLSLLLLTAVLLTYSRASYLAVGWGLLLLVIRQGWPRQGHRNWQLVLPQALRRSWPYLILLGLLVAGLGWLPRPGGEGVRLERTSTIITRVDGARQDLSVLDSPTNFILGQGLLVPPSPVGTSLYSGTRSHAKVPDNWLILLLVGTGVVGTALWLGVVLKLWHWAWGQQSFLGAAIGATLVHGFFNASLTYPFVWLVLLGWAVSAGRRGKSPDHSGHSGLAQHPRTSAA